MMERKMRFVVRSIFLIALLAISSGSFAATPIAVIKRETPVNFQRDILPILQKNCLACHSSSEANGELNLENPAAILKGGDSGPAVIPRNSKDSFLLQVASHAEEPIMPPEDNDVAAAALTSEQLGLIKLWIDQGATGSATAVGISPTNWRPLPPGSHPIYAVAVTEDGQFAACSRANQIFIYHVATGQIITRLTDPQLQQMSDDKLPGVAHLDSVQSLAFNRAGDMLASGGFRTVKLWRYPRDVQRLKLAVGQPVSAVAVSPDRTLAATGAADNSIKIWDITSGELQADIAGHVAAVTALEFTHDGAKLVSASSDKTVRVWNVADGEPIGRIDSPQPVQALTLVQAPPVAASANPGDEPTDEENSEAKTIQRVATGGGDKLIRLWKLPESLPAVNGEAPAGTKILATSRDGNYLVMAAADGTVRVERTATGKLVKTWKAHEAEIFAVAFAPIPETPAESAAAADASENTQILPPLVLATSAADKTIRLWNFETGELVNELRGSMTPVTSLAFQPNGKRLAAGTEDGKTTIWNLEAPQPTQLAAAVTPAEQLGVLSVDGKLLATAGQENGRSVIRVREMATGKVLHTLLGHEAAITALAFSADGTKIVSGSADKTARVWNLADEKFPEVARFAGHTTSVGAVALNAAATQVLSGSATGEAKLWNVADASETMNFAGHTAAIVGAAITSAGQPITASADKTIRVWNAADGKQVRAITAAQPITGMAMSRDSAQLAVAVTGGVIMSYQVANGAALKEFTAHQADVESLSYSADNARLVSAGADKLAIAWRVADGRLLEILPSDKELSFAICGPTADTMVVGDAAGTVRVDNWSFALSLEGIAAKVTALAYHSGGQALYMASADGTVRGFNPTNGQAVFTANHGAAVHDLTLSPDDQRLASAGEDNVIKLWNTANGAAIAPTQLTGFAGPVHRVVFSKDGKRIVGGAVAATADGPGEIFSFNAADGALEESFSGHAGAIQSIVAVGTNSDPQILAASGEGSVQQWQLTSLNKFGGHTQPITALASFPAAPMQIVSGAADNTVRHWNLENGQQLRSLNQGSPITAVAVRGDGQRIAGAGANNSIRLWNVANNQQLAEMKGDLRAKTLVAKLTQRKSATEQQVTQANTALKTAQDDLPKKQEAAKTAAEAVAAAAKDVEAKAAVLTTAETTKAAAEKLAIEMAAAAQKAVSARQTAEQTALELAARAKLLADKAAQAKTAAAADPNNPALAQAVTAASQTAGAADAEAKAAESTKATATQAATAATKAADDAVTKALATNKPYTDALAALTAAQTAHRQAAAADEIAKRDAQRATELVPSIEADVAKLETRLQQLTADLEAATKATAEAEKPIRAIAFSPDNLTLATGGDFGAVHTWDANTGAAVASYVGHTGPVQSLAFTDNGGIVSGSADAQSIVWDLNPSWKLEQTIGGIDDPATFAYRVRALAFNEDGTQLATGSGVPSRGGEVKIWNVEDGGLATAIPEAHTDSVLDVEFSRDGEYLASASADKFIRVFEVATGKQIHKLEGHTNYALGVTWRADGKRIATCSADNTIMIWNAENGDRIRTIQGFQKQVFAVQFVGQTNTVAMCAGNRIVRMYNTDNGGLIRTFAGTGSDYVYSLAITPNSQILLAGGHDSVLRVWNGTANNSQPLKQIEPPKDTPPPEEITSAGANN